MLGCLYYSVLLPTTPTTLTALAGALASYKGSPFLNNCRCMPSARNLRITGVIALATDSAIWIKMKRRVSFKDVGGVVPVVGSASPTLLSGLFWLFWWWVLVVLVVLVVPSVERVIEGHESTVSPTQSHSHTW